MLPETHKIEKCDPFLTNRKLIILGVPIIKHMTVFSLIFFIIFIGATTISASSTPNGQVVYTATINDDEGDPITMAMPSCTPTPCPFAVNNGKPQKNPDVCTVK